MTRRRASRREAGQHWPRWFLCDACWACQRTLVSCLFVSVVLLFVCCKQCLDSTRLDAPCLVLCNYFAFAQAQPRDD
jgi:hypothetical protein